VNYFLSQLTATQVHHAGGFFPSYRPSFQFQTRYSRFLWARDIKAVPVEEVRKLLAVELPEKVWWERLVYRREREEGYDLIVHFVRIPPTEEWDIEWVDEPEPLEGVEVALMGVEETPATVQACRPYHFEEPQQVVQTELEPRAEANELTVEVPPFRYHSMLVFRFGQ
jgi:hypothetical protein